MQCGFSKVQEVFGNKAKYLIVAESKTITSMIFQFYYLYLCQLFFTFFNLTYIASFKIWKKCQKSVVLFAMYQEVDKCTIRIPACPPLLCGPWCEQLSSVFCRSRSCVLTTAVTSDSAVSLVDQCALVFTLNQLRHHPPTTITIPPAPTSEEVQGGGSREEAVNIAAVWWWN